MFSRRSDRIAEGRVNSCLATRDEVQGLIAQGRTIQETIAIAGDVVKKLIEAHSNSGSEPLALASEEFDYPLIVAT